MSTVVIGDIAEVFNGKTPAKSEQRETGYPVLKIRDVDALGNFRGSYESFVDVELAEKFRSKHLCAGDILILNAAHNAEYVASKTFFASEDYQKPLITGEWTVVRSNTAVTDPHYVRRYIESTAARQRIKEMVNGIHLYPKDVAKCPISLPPLTEQRRIAAILDKADVLRAKRREAIAKLDQLLQSVFLEMFGDPATNPKGWPTGILKQLGKVQTGSTPPSSEAGMFGGEIPFVTPGDLGGVVVNTKRSVTSKGADKIRLASAGSTFVCCIGATIGKMGFATKESTFNQQINAVSWEAEIEAVYGFYTMTFFAKEIATRGASTTLPILKKSEFEKIAIPVAPKQLQATFKNFIDKYSLEKKKITLSMTKTEAIFASLQSRAFTEGL